MNSSICPLAELLVPHALINYSSSGLTAEQVVIKAANFSSDFGPTQSQRIFQLFHLCTRLFLFFSTTSENETHGVILRQRNSLLFCSIRNHITHNPQVTSACLGLRLQCVIVTPAQSRRQHAQLLKSFFHMSKQQLSAILHPIF